MKLHLKKLALTMALVATGLACAPSAQASDDILTLYQADKFVEKLNLAINDKDVEDTQSFLNVRIPNYGTFGTAQVPVYHPGFAHSSWGTTLAPDGLIYNRYPGLNAPYYNHVGIRKLGKGDFIGSIIAKKKTIPDYKMQIQVVSVQKIGEGSALLEVHVKEWSATYQPYHNTFSNSLIPNQWNGYVHSGLDSVSKCHMRLKKELGSVYLTQMECKYI